MYNVARASAGEVRSLLYVIEDDYPDYAAEAVELREDANKVGKLAQLGGFG